MLAVCKDPQPRCGWKCWWDGNPGWLVPRNSGLSDRAPLGLTPTRLSNESFKQIGDGLVAVAFQTTPPPSLRRGIHLDEGWPGAFETPGNFFGASMPSLLPMAISLVAW